MVREYLFVESGNDALLLRCEGYGNHLVKNGAALAVSSYADIPKFAGRYVTVVGTSETVPRSERFTWIGRVTPHTTC